MIRCENIENLPNYCYTYLLSELSNEFDLKTGRTDRFIKTLKIDSSFIID